MMYLRSPCWCRRSLVYEIKSCCDEDIKEENIAVECYHRHRFSQYLDYPR